MTRRLVPLSLLLVALVAWAVYARSDQPAGVLHALTRARPERAFPARLSVQTVYRPCNRVELPADSTVPREDCGGGSDMPLKLGPVAGAGESFAPDSLHASALTKVLWWDGKTASLDETILRLSEALRLQEDSVALLVDLSAVRLFRAQEAQTPNDLVAALNHALEALAIEPRNLSALWNAALATEALYLDVSADSAWSAYLAVDGDSPWADEASKRRDALRKRPFVLDTPTVSSSEPEVRGYADRHPQQARELGWHEVLGAWGNAVLGDSTVRADSLLRLASYLGAALVDSGGDASLADAVKAIRDVRNDPAATIALAHAHAAYACGHALFYSNFAAARDSFVRAVEMQPPSPALVGWALVSAAGAGVYLRGGDSPDAGNRALLADIDTLRYPVLAARIHWVLGKTLFDEGEYAVAQAHVARAAPVYQRLGEAQNYGAVRTIEAWASYEQGDTVAGYRMAHQAAVSLGSDGPSQRLHNLLLDLARFAVRDGMPSTALIFHNEDVGVASQVSSLRLALPEALQSRAAFYAAQGETGRAHADLDSATVLFRALTDSNQVAFFRHTRAVIGNRAAADVDSAIAFFTRDKRNMLWGMAALMRRANLRLARRDLQGAVADLDSITAQVERASEREPIYHFRLALIEQARSLFDQLVMLHVRDNRPREALQALERGRVSFRPGTDSRPTQNNRLRGPAGRVVLEYALIGDTLLAWTVRGDSVTLDQWAVDRDSLVFAVERADRALEHSGREAIAQPLLERLHDWLMGPVLARLPDSARIVIVADGEIGRVPFAALRNRRTARDLLDDYTLSSASGLPDAGRPQPAASSTLRALLVADPAFDSAEHPTLDTLAGARAEMQVLRGLYPGADTLSGANASIDALRARAPGADVIHYAGHAIFDDASPERSFLVLAGVERLAADRISRWDLDGVRLVVLSACSTIRARHGRSGGFAGLSGAFLSAGAGGVVGSLWKVDDELAQPLMEAFHREYQVSRDPADALRKAQLKMRSQGHSPAVWAGFRYVGGSVR